jgi:hypothetical protein
MLACAALLFAVTSSSGLPATLQELENRKRKYFSNSRQIEEIIDISISSPNSLSRSFTEISAVLSSDRAQTSVRISHNNGFSSRIVATGRALKFSIGNPSLYSLQGSLRGLNFQNLADEIFDWSNTPFLEISNEGVCLQSLAFGQKNLHRSIPKSTKSNHWFFHTYQDSRSKSPIKIYQAFDKNTFRPTNLEWVVPNQAAVSLTYRPKLDLQESVRLTFEQNPWTTASINQR